ncbi:MAG: protein of unknown function SprT [Gemmatimonadetes bacterium]|nr:protein of unknown function SprT [Gemmatimonadota bacterium]
MLQALTRFFRRRVDEAQLELVLHAATPANADELLARLRQLGLKSISKVRLTRNRNVMVSFGEGVLRANEGYLTAPEPVLRGIVAFVEGRTRADRHAGRDVIVGFPIQVTSKAPPRREKMHDDDRELAAQLSQWHARYNARHFGSQLRDVEMRVSRRMKSRLGHYSAATGGIAAEIAISRSHIKRHGWTEALHTLLHEMVHQWQDETGGPIDHGGTFRKKCREVGIAPYARRVLAGRVNAPARRAARES